MTTEQPPLFLVQQQLTHVTQLKVLLLSEKEVLQQQSIDALTAVTNDKKNLLLLIEQLDQEIKSIVDIDSVHAEQDIATHLNSIENIIIECKAINQINGAVIQQSGLAVDRMKNSLLESRSRNTMTYNSKGKKSGGLSSKSIKA